MSNSNRSKVVLYYGFVQTIVDRHFSSVPLMHSMARRGTFVVGTCTTAGRSLLPKELMKGGKVAENLKRGEYMFAGEQSSKYKNEYYDSSCIGFHMSIVLQVG